METPFGSEPGDSFTSKHYLSGWCPECGRRRGADARCGNCDPWWTSPLVQAGVPAILGVLFLMTTASTLARQAQKPRETVVVRSGSAARLLTVKVKRPDYHSRASTASITPVLSSDVNPEVEAAAAALRIQREGAYINAVLRAQDEARRSQQIAARNREYTFALQQRLQAMQQRRAQSRFVLAAPPIRRGDPVSRGSARLEEIVTGETVIVPQ